MRRQSKTAAVFARLLRLSNPFWLAVMGLVALSPRLCGQGFYWTRTSAPVTQWQAIASSADGTKLVAVDYGNGFLGGGIYTSTNSGVSWTLTSAPTSYWSSVASSADGTILLAAAEGGALYGGGIYASANSGVSWYLTGAGSADWQSVASSADGTKWVAGLYTMGFSGGGIYTAVNPGSRWLQTSAPAGDWRSVASSADGMKLVVVYYGGGIVTSADSGLSWTMTQAPGVGWVSVASSADGTKLAAVAQPNGRIYFTGAIYTSSDSGGTWTHTSAPSKYWSGIQSSADGTKLVAVVSGGGIYASTNSGASWTLTSAPNAGWSCVAGSADGTKWVAAAWGGGIYTVILPVVTQQPASLLSCPGSAPTLKVAVGGAPPFSCQWRKNGTPLVEGGNVSGSATTNLTLLNVTPSDTANYDVVVTNAYGSVTSAVATVTVTLMPATAAPIISNGVIVGATLLSGGCGYTTSPAITFRGSGGSGAVGYGQASNGTVTNIVITSGGSGYPANTPLLIAPPIYPTLGITRSQFSPTSVIPNASNLMAGQFYALQVANGLDNWTSYSSVFIATNTVWTAPSQWNVTVTNQLFFRLQLLQ